MNMNQERMEKCPDKASLKDSLATIAKIESELHQKLQKISTLSRPPNIDANKWRHSIATMVEKAKAEAESRKLPFMAVVKLAELHQIYDTLTASQDKENVQSSEVFNALGDAERKIQSAIEEASKQLKLDFGGFLLGTLPASILKLSSALVSLDISNNNLEIFPEIVSELVNLETLDVHSNSIKLLPDSIGKLVKLKTLNVSGNCLPIIPDAIENCRALEELVADFNQLTQLPDGIGFELVNLRKLSVHSNKLRSLPYSTSHMMNLRFLDAHLNKLCTFPEDIEKLTSLEYLNVSNNFNYLTSIPDTIGTLVALVELDISFNQISIIPYSVCMLQNLRRLMVEGNPIIMPPASVVDRGFGAIIQYLEKKCKNSNRTSMGETRRRSHSNPPRKSWLGSIMTPGRLLACGSPSTTKIDRKSLSWSDHGKVHEEEDEAYEGIMHGGVSSSPFETQRRATLFSRLRIFSPRSSPMAFQSLSTPSRSPRHAYSTARF